MRKFNKVVARKTGDASPLSEVFTSVSLDMLRRNAASQGRPGDNKTLFKLLQFK